ncbi:rubrerythrin family protein [Methanosphaerula palustris]|uniref:Rubrerythrin n=1 Tax=Methanosphaerula palustris (strain ATCC BAA-1556 / DSM 19958 / E1-9c) TaxID=521011 RepID=B8GJM9_METPE|nr:ferritin family protein [Methanosphaerula palustris]ACL15683.1 Rubrerythrin [Methanosphaerula palustris E1-9c]
MATEDDALEAFAGESQANRKYLAFSEKAVGEGFANVGKLFLAASEAEAIHARRLLQVLGAVKSTATNLEGSVEGETHEYTEMYPQFVRDAEAEGRMDAVMAFKHAMKAEEVHAGLYKQAVEAVKSGKDFEAQTIYLCPICGNIVVDTVPDKCPICNAKGSLFKAVQ